MISINIFNVHLVNDLLFYHMFPCIKAVYFNHSLLVNVFDLLQYFVLIIDLLFPTFNYDILLFT